MTDVVIARVLVVLSAAGQGETSASSSFWWLTPAIALFGALLAFAGALLGAVVSPWVSGAVAERRADKALIREARIALERWNSTQVGPNIQSFPGISAQEIPALQRKLNEDFLDRHFDYTREARAALGPVQHLDPVIEEVVNSEDWRIPADKVPDLREALSNAEKRLFRRPQTAKQNEAQ